MLVQLQGPPLSNPTCLPTCIYFSYIYCIHHLPTSPTSYSTAPATLCGAAAHGQQLGGRNRLATLVIIITTHIGVTGLASYHRYRRIEHVHWITSKHWTGSPPIATVLAAER